MKHGYAFRMDASRKSGGRQNQSEARARLVCRLLRVCPGAVVLLALCLAAPAWSQAHEAGTGGGLSISVGAMGSGFYLGYGERKVLGYAAFVDADTRSRIGIEAEGRWLRYHKTDDVDATTYLIGGRYHADFGRSFQVYGKGLVGGGLFNFPYGYAHGSYFVVAPGAGVDYHLFKRFYWRVDGEYQLWPGFTFGSMSSYGVSTGFRVRAF
jgi:hypothetical protein